VNPTSDADRIRMRGEVRAEPPVTPPVTPPVGNPVERLLFALAAGDLDGAGLRVGLKLRDKTHLRERHLMLTSLELENFKGIADRQRVDARGGSDGLAANGRGLALRTRSTAC